MAEKRSLSPEVFRNHFGNLLHAVKSAEELAELLCAEGLIRIETKIKAISTDAATENKTKWLLKDVQDTLEASNQPENVLMRVCNVLEESGERALQRIARRMRSDNGKNPKQSI